MVDLPDGARGTGSDSRFEPATYIFGGAVVCFLAGADSLATLSLGVLSPVEDFMAFDLLVLQWPRTTPADKSFSSEQLDNS
jgi:hypothetical protein